jgi:cell division protein YceG involved in septum cleavage
MNLKKTSSAILSTSIKIVVYMLVAVGIYVILSGAFSFGELIFSENGMVAKGNGTEIQVTIPKDASSKEVGDILKKNGLIENSYAFVIQVMLYEADIVPGKYALNTEENPKEIIEILSGVTKDQEE